MSQNPLVGKAGVLDIFEVGDYAGWRDSNPIYRGQIERHGDGPFKVISVKWVPPVKCTCIQKDDNSDVIFHSGGCDKEIYEGISYRDVGHPQWVTVVDGFGKSIQFSGLFFLKVAAP